MAQGAARSTYNVAYYVTSNISCAGLFVAHDKRKRGPQDLTPHTARKAKEGAARTPQSTISF